MRIIEHGKIIIENQKVKSVTGFVVKDVPDGDSMHLFNHLVERYERPGEQIDDLKKQLSEREAELQKERNKFETHWAPLVKEIGRQNQKKVDGLEAEIGRLKSENAELQSLFDLQHTRSETADAEWCKVHGKEPGSIKPDLGELLRWLLEERASLSALVSVQREALEEISKVKALEDAEGKIHAPFFKWYRLQLQLIGTTAERALSLSPEHAMRRVEGMMAVVEAAQPFKKWYQMALWHNEIDDKACLQIKNLAEALAHLEAIEGSK